MHTPQSQHRKTYVVTGTSGVVGTVVADILTRQGHRVRAISRYAGTSVDNPDAITAAFHAADGAFLMIPFDRNAAGIWKAAATLSYPNGTASAGAVTDAAEMAGTRTVAEVLERFNQRLRWGD